MHIRTLVAVCLASTLLAARAEAQFQARNPAPGENYHVELGAMFWTPEPGIVILSNSLAPISAAGVDFVQEFNIQKARFMEFRGVVKGGKHKLRISRLPIKYDEAAVLQRTVVFGGRTFNVNANATADLQWDLWRFGYEYDFAVGDAGYVGFIAEVKHNQVVADLRATQAGTTLTSLTDVTVPAPQLGIVGRVYPHRLVSITAEFTGLKVPGWIRERFTDADNFEADFKDFEVYGTVSITRYLGIQGGYRALDVDYVVDDDAGNLDMKGPYFGGVVRF
jgi:hypothetical protein